jgi:hypothetical protein
MSDRRSTLLPCIALAGTVLALAGGCGKVKAKDDMTSSGTAGDTGAGGSTGTAGAAGTVHVAISGTAAPHPLNRVLLMDDEDFSMLKVAIVDPSAVSADPTAPPLGSMTLDTSACDPTTGCPWNLAGVDITHLARGLVGTLEDTRTGTARVWVNTDTDMGTGDDLDAVRAAPAPIKDRRAFAVSRKLTAALAAFVSPVLGGTPLTGDDLEARGFLIGHIVGQVVGTATPAGVEGAKAAATGAFDIIYPDATFSGVGTSTSATGIFLMVPKAAAPVVATFDVVPRAGDARAWLSHTGGANPGSAFIMIMPAS